MMKDRETSLGGLGGSFPSTHWSFVLSSPDRSTPDCLDRMNTLVAQYWKPVYRTIRLGWRKNNEDAKDLTQAFLADLLERKFWLSVDPQKGRFRHYLKGALKNYLMNDKRDAARLKRGGGKPIFSIDALEAVDKEIDLSDEGQPDEVFDREWASELLEEATKAVERSLAEKGKDTYFEVFRRYDLEPEEDRPPTYKEVASALGITESDVRNYLSSVRSNLRQEIITRISEYALTEEEIFEELRELLGGGA